MGFLSYNLSFYQEELQKLEHTPATPERINRARRLLRMLEDLSDEGYFELQERMEETFFGVTRLKTYLKSNRAVPFAAPPKQANTKALFYAQRETELCGTIAQAVRTASAMPKAKPTPWADKLRRFCRWIGYDEKTAYLFLLRNTLLPYVYFFARGRKHIAPWLLSRSSFAALTGQKGADDEIRASVYKALEAGCADFPSLIRFVRPEMKKTIGRYPQAESALRSMLEEIKKEKILVVESGCTGTFPLLLMSLDSRVEMRMYTAYPYLADIFGERLFTTRYEENRMFETMASQEAYFRFSKIHGGRFYVQKCTDTSVEKQALAGIKRMRRA